MVYGGGRRTGRAPGRRAGPEPAATLPAAAAAYMEEAVITPSRTRARTRRRSCTRARARARTSDQSAVGSAGRPAETRLYRYRRSRVAGAAPCAAHFHTDCGVLICMAGAARRQHRPGCARFEPARCDSAPSLGRSKI